jgi:hypothetical protein
VRNRDHQVSTAHPDSLQGDADRVGTRTYPDTLRRAAEAREGRLEVRHDRTSYKRRSVDQAAPAALDVSAYLVVHGAQVSEGYVGHWSLE